MTVHPSPPVPLRTAAAMTTAVVLAMIARAPTPPTPPARPSPMPSLPTTASPASALFTATLPAAAGAVLLSAARPASALRPLPTDADGSRRAPVPILLYHHVSSDAPATAALRETTVSPEALERHLDVLAEGGWTVVTLDAVVDALGHGTPLAAKPVVLTFDDGWRDQFDIALPILLRRGVSATFFITTEPVEAGWIGSLSWDHVKALTAAGMSIGAHTRTHRDLRALSDAALADELTGSADLIAERTGTRPRLLAYPYGGFDDRVERAVAATGYTAAVTVNPDGHAASDRLLALPRIAVRGWCDTKVAFEGCVGVWLGPGHGKGD